MIVAPGSEADRTVVSVWCVPLHGSTAAKRARSHAALRLILAAVTGSEPRALRFATGYRGKPYLLDPRAPHFSLSHSGDVALIAVTYDGPVGVDVERIRPDLEIAAFARNLVAPDEVGRIEALPHERRERAWFQAWTRLEAVAKASGAGLCQDVVEGPVPAPFCTRDLDVDQAHVGAVAVQAPAASIIYETLAGFAA